MKFETGNWRAERGGNRGRGENKLNVQEEAPK